MTHTTYTLLQALLYCDVIYAQFRELANIFPSIPRARFRSPKQVLIISIDLPPVKPSAIALGTAYNSIVAGAVLAPIFGETYHRAQAANTKEEFFKSKEAATAAASTGSAVVGSAIQTYGVGALINATGTLSYKGAGYLGALIFFASSAPSVRLSGIQSSSRDC